MSAETALEEQQAQPTRIPQHARGITFHTSKGAQTVQEEVVDLGPGVPYFIET
jgi:hypothetical protein